MTKAAALKKRYVLFHYKGPENSGEMIKRGIYNEALKFFGEFGLSKIALKLISFDEKTKTGILRCERAAKDDVLGFLAIVSSVNGKKARLVAVRSSGTLAALERKSSA